MLSEDEAKKRKALYGEGGKYTERELKNWVNLINSPTYRTDLF
jgi:hypothetical protein